GFPVGSTSGLAIPDAIGPPHPRHRPLATISRADALPQQRGGDLMPGMASSPEFRNLTHGLPFALIRDTPAPKPLVPVAGIPAISQPRSPLIFPSQPARPVQEPDDAKPQSGFPIIHENPLERMSPGAAERRGEKTSPDHWQA